MTLAEYLRLLTGVAQRNGYALAKCPAHDDQRQSLSVREGRNHTILLKCHAGCLAAAIVAAQGLPMSALFADAPARGRRGPLAAVPTSRIVATYDYESPDGVLLYQAVRCEPKRFFQRQPDPEHPGQWLNTMSGITRVLYRLADLHALRPSRVVIVEGEKDADALWALGIPATTSVAGAGKWPGHDYPAQLVAAGVQEIVVTPDNDEPGRSHMKEVADSTGSTGMIAVRWLSLDVPPKGDVSDYLAAGGTAATFLALLAQARPWPFRTTLPDVHDVFHRWLGESYDLEVLDAVLAAAASERLTGDPCWLMVISGSGAAKTETVAALEGAGALIRSRLVSEGALLSGSSRRERAADATGGLLRVIGTRGILVLKDFTSTLTADRNQRGSLLSALREIHDGRWVREVGTDGGRTLEWQGRLMVIGACTSAWDRNHEAVATMGDRFVLIRFDSHLGRESAFNQAMANSGFEVQMRQELAEAVGMLLAGVDPGHSLAFTELSPDEHQRFFNMVNLVTFARTAVDSDFREDVVTPHMPEAPTRYGKQLWQIVRGATALGMSRNDALNLAGRCAQDTVPPVRMAILKYLAAHPESRTQDVAKGINLPWNTVKRQLDALKTLDLILSHGEHPDITYWLKSNINPDVLRAFSVNAAPSDMRDREPGDESETTGTTTQTVNAPVGSRNIPF